VRNSLLLLFLVPISVPALGQVNISASNVMRYGSSHVIVNDLLRQKEYFENLTDTRIAFSNFVVGFRLLYDAPPEIGREFVGIRKRFIEFSKDDVSVRGGDSYSLYGRGLALNAFENRALGFDTGIEGIKFEYQNSFLKTSATGGNITYVDILDPGRTEDYRIRGGSVEIVPYRFLSGGVSFVSGNVRFRDITPPGEVAGRFDMPEVFIRARMADIDLFASYTEKRTGVSPNTLFGTAGRDHKGSAVYGSVSYSKAMFGVSVEYKDYRLGLPDPVERIDPNRPNRALAFQNGPIVHKEHSFTLLTRYPHIIDFNDEVGYQIDLFATPVEPLIVSMNVSSSSRHHAFRSTGVMNPRTGYDFYDKVERSSAWLPSRKAQFSPFFEFYGDAQFYFDEGGTDYVLLGFNRRMDKVAEEIPRTPIVVEKNSFGIPLAIQYTLFDGWAAKFVTERQWVHDESNAAQHDFTNQLFSIGVSRSPRYSVALRYEYTTDRGSTDRRRDWTAVEFGLRVGQSHNIAVAVGGDRGGQVCSNGVCRVVPPFLGVRASVISYL
jgi:hypothetical protein